MVQHLFYKHKRSGCQQDLAILLNNIMPAPKKISGSKSPAKEVNSSEKAVKKQAESGGLLNNVRTQCRKKGMDILKHASMTFSNL